MKSIIIALTLFSSFAAFAKLSCTPVSCEAVSRKEINEIRTQGIGERLANDPQLIEELRQSYRPSFHSISFEDYVAWKLPYYEQNFKATLVHHEENLRAIENQYRLSFSDETLMMSGKRILSAKDILTNKNTCLIDKKKGKRKKSCHSQRRSCAGQILFIFSLGGFGSSNCREAHSDCRYSRDWELVVKTRIDGQEVILPLSERISGEHAENKHHNIMIGMASKARKKFKRNDNEIAKLVKKLPRCD